jgi:DNA (cytosine-5)-methyltransferase 1
MSGLTAVSLFAGIEGIGLAFHRAGIKVVAAVEIDPACRGVIARHFPDVALFEDVTEVTGDQLRAAGFVPGRGVLAGGWPCQDLSIAGRRAGLGGSRSGLFWQVVRLARELSPQWLVLENVDGLLSAVCSCPGNETCVINGRAVACGRWETRNSERRWLACVTHTPEGGACRNGCMPVHGGSMGTVVGALGKLGYGYAGRVLDAEYFGVPQQRNRLFFVGCLGDRANPAEVLFDTDGSDGRLAENQAPWPETSAPVVVSTLQGGGRRGHRIDAESAAGGHLIVASTLTAGVSASPGVNAPGRRREDDTNLVCVTGSVTHALTSEGADASEDGTGRGAPLVAVSNGVRRFTPRERERLQGFPDDWTRWRLENGALVEQSDSARDRQTGNAVAVPVAEWLARRLVAADEAATGHERKQSPAA